MTRGIGVITPAEYRQFAEECLHARQLAQVPEVRAALLLMAQRWVDQAQRAERNAALLADLKTETALPHSLSGG